VVYVIIIVQKLQNVYGLLGRHSHSFFSLLREEEINHVEVVL